MNKRQHKKIQKRQKPKIDLQEAIDVMSQSYKNLYKIQWRNLSDYQEQLNRIGYNALDNLTLLRKMIDEYKKENEARQANLDSYETIWKANKDTFLTLFDHLNDKANEHYKGHFLRLQEVIERVEKREEFLAFWTFGCVVVTIAGLLLFFLS